MQRKNIIMKRNISERPDRWVVLEMPDKYYRVFCSWSGGYLDADRWRLNSGIKKVEQDDDYYYFTGFSESCYACHKKKYGTTFWGESVMNKIIEQAGDKIRLMEDIDDWSSVV